MMCESPFVRDSTGKIFKLYAVGSISRDELHRGIPFPCGQCLACRINKRREWTARLMLESLMHDGDTCFLTLTYDDEHLPENRSLNKRDLQLFFKRLRAALDVKIRYYACGEYGEKSHRPHYHAIIYGVPAVYLYEQFFERFWCEEGKGNISRKRLGMCHLGYDCSMSAIQYVAGYVTKKFVKSSGWDVVKEFAVMSRRPALGVPALKIIAEAMNNAGVQNNHTIRFGKRIFPIGRTLSDKLSPLIGVDPCQQTLEYFEHMFHRFFSEVVPNPDVQSLLDLMCDESDAARKRAYRLHTLFNHRDAI